ncbi:MAG: ABC transporter substrate-binding protein [Gemmatimonas sp.]
MLKRVFATVAGAAVLLAAGIARADDSAPAMKELIAAAKAERQVELLLSGQVPTLLRPMMRGFEQRYGIRVNAQVGGGDQNGQRILAERRVGRYTLDVWLGGANTALVQLLPNNALAPVEELLVDPDVTNLDKWYKRRHYYVDPEQQYVLAFAAQPMQTVSFNTKLVKESDITSFHDLLDPKWKGKMVSWNPAMEGAGVISVAMYLHPNIGEEWFVRWAREMQVTIVDDVRQGAEWVALGRYPLGIFGISTNALKLQREGLPIQAHITKPMAEGPILVNSATNVMVMDRAPHPKAAQLFVNWVLSRDVQQEIMKTSKVSNSLRTDTDDSILEEQYRKDPNADYYVPFADKRYQTEQTQIINRIREIMKEAGYR